MTRSLLAITAAALVLACGAGGARSVRPPAPRWYQPRPAGAPAAAAGPTATASTPSPAVLATPALCGVRIEGLDALLQPGAVLVFGDPFGTNEVPAFLEVAACHAAQAGHGILLALEIPAPEQPLLDAFLVSGGTPADRAALLGGRFWNRPYQDGRSSRAVYELVDRVRALRSQAPARVVGIDQPALQGSERDAFMAGKVLQAREQAPGSVTFVLTGNAHARTVKGAPWDAEFLPLGWHLEKAVGKRLLSLDASFSRGQAWVCNLLPEPVCGPREMPRPRHTLGTLWRNAVMAGDVPRVERFGARTGEGFDGIFFVGAISASGPAKAFY